MYAGLNIIDELEKERHINDKIVNATAPFKMSHIIEFVFFCLDSKMTVKIL